jgi:hypothetical protein
VISSSPLPETVVVRSVQADLLSGSDPTSARRLHLHQRPRAWPCVHLSSEERRIPQQRHSTRAQLHCQIRAGPETDSIDSFEEVDAKEGELAVNGRVKSVALRPATECHQPTTLLRWTKENARHGLGSWLTPSHTVYPRETRIDGLIRSTTGRDGDWRTSRDCAIYHAATCSRTQQRWRSGEVSLRGFKPD